MSSIVVQVPCDQVSHVNHLFSNHSYCNYGSKVARLQCDPAYQQWLGKAIADFVQWGNFGEILIIYSGTKHYWIILSDESH